MTIGHRALLRGIVGGLAFTLAIISLLSAALDLPDVPAAIGDLLFMAWFGMIGLVATFAPPTWRRR